MPHMQGISVKGFVVLTLAFRREGTMWLGRCVELSTSTYARTLEQAKRELVEMVECHLNTLEEVGERERFLHEHEIEFHTRKQAAAEVRPSLTLDGKSYVQARQFPVSVYA